MALSNSIERSTTKAEEPPVTWGSNSPHHRSARSTRAAKAGSGRSESRAAVGFPLAQSRGATVALVAAAACLQQSPAHAYMRCIRYWSSDYYFVHGVEVVYVRIFVCVHSMAFVNFTGEEVENEDVGTCYNGALE